jgi:hypothetical protein
MGAVRVTMSGSRTSLRRAIDCSTSKRFAGNTHMDERREGGVIRADPVETSS